MARARNGDPAADVTTPETDAAIEAPVTQGAAVPEMSPTPEPEPQSEAVSPSDPASAAASEASPPRPGPASRRGGFLPTVFGGAVAAALGFGAAAYVLPRVWTPQVPVDAVAAVRDGLAQQSARLDTLAADVEALAADPATHDLAAAQATLSETTAGALAEIRDSLAALDSRIGDGQARLNALDGRLSSLEKRPVEGGAASATALDAFGREMEALRAEMATQKSAVAEAQAQLQAEAAGATETIRAAVAEADRLRTEAEETARRATARAALGRIQAALTAGGALDPALADLRSTGIEVPPALAEQGQGVPTLEALRAAFPAAARDALAASLRETAGGSLWDRSLAFLRTQSGARSLTPREGADPDAVLSRAEAALAAGDPGAAITAIETLPEAGQARMAEWVTLAKRRIAATAAAAALAAELE